MIRKCTYCGKMSKVEIVGVQKFCDDCMRIFTIKQALNELNYIISNSPMEFMVDIIEDHVLNCLKELTSNVCVDIYNRKKRLDK